MTASSYNGCAVKGYTWRSLFPNHMKGVNSTIFGIYFRYMYQVIYINIIASGTLKYAYRRLAHIT